MECWPTLRHSLGFEFAFIVSLLFRSERLAVKSLHRQMLRKEKEIGYDAE